MKSIDEPLIKRSLYRAFTPRIILLEDDASIAEQIKQGLEIEAIQREMFRGNLSFWELLEELEPYIDDMDAYTDDVLSCLEIELYGRELT